MGANSIFKASDTPHVIPKSFHGSRVQWMQVIQKNLGKTSLSSKEILDVMIAEYKIVRIAGTWRFSGKMNY